MVILYLQHETARTRPVDINTVLLSLCGLPPELSKHKHGGPPNGEPPKLTPNPV